MRTPSARSSGHRGLGAPRPLLQRRAAPAAPQRGVRCARGAVQRGAEDHRQLLLHLGVVGQNLQAPLLLLLDRDERRDRRALHAFDQLPEALQRRREHPVLVGGRSHVLDDLPEALLAVRGDVLPRARHEDVRRLDRSLEGRPDLADPRALRRKTQPHLEDELADRQGAELGEVGADVRTGDGDDDVLVALRGGGAV